MTNGHSSALDLSPQSILNGPIVIISAMMKRLLLGLLDYIHWFVLIKQHVIVVLFRPNWWLCSEWVYISSQTKLALTKGSFPLPNLNSTSSAHTMLKCLESFHITKEVFTQKNTHSSQPVQNNKTLGFLLLNRQCAPPNTFVVQNRILDSQLIPIVNMLQS